MKTCYHDFMKHRRAMGLPLKTEGEDSLQITVPHVTKKSLKLRAAETGDPMRVIVLRALAAAGMQVPEKELRGRRKAK
jgi:hypothetical protein